MTDKGTKQEIRLRKFLHEAHFQLIGVLTQSKNKTQNFHKYLELSLMIHKSLAEKLRRKNLTSAFWCLLYTSWSTDLLTKKAQLPQMTEQGPTMTKQQQNEKPEKLMEPLADPAVWKLLAGAEAAGWVLLFVSCVVVEVVAAAAAAAVAADESADCSQFHF